MEDYFILGKESALEIRPCLFCAYKLGISYNVRNLQHGRIDSRIYMFVVDLGNANHTRLHRVGYKIVRTLY